MKKRALAGVLWFLAAAYMWNLVATIGGVSTAPAVLVGAVAAIVVWGDPLHRIWAAGTRAD
jgi:hypothetical protein